ncbi:MAG: peptidylprolyl isomerase [Paracoccaceae bacterium]
MTQTSPIFAQAYALRFRGGLTALALLALLTMPATALAQDTTPAPETEATEADAPETEATEADTTDTDAAETPEAGEADADADVPTMALDALTADTVIATVDGYDVTLGELIAVRLSLPEQYRALPPEILAEGLLQQLITQTALAMRARAAGIDETPAIRTTLKNIENGTLAEAYVSREVAARVTDEAIQAAYAERFESAEPVEEIRASHILVEDLERAAALKAELDAGADFADLARENGTDGTRARGGDLGYFTKADMVPEFGEAAFALEVGEISEPVESPFGWHLIQLVDRRNQPVPPLEDVAGEIVEGLSQTARRVIADEAVADAEISRPDEVLPPAAILAEELLRPAAE